MTTNLLNDAKKSDGDPKAARVLAIGEADAHVVSCPSCGRPLAEGTSTCPGCGVRLVMGVPVKRAGAILALGVVLGLLVGGVATAAAITLSHRDPVAAVTPVASAAPVEAAASVAPSIAIRDPGAPTTAVSALSGTAVVNGRIAVDAMTLTTTLARPNATTIEIARALRSLAADAALGIDLAGRLAPWTDAKQVEAGLDDFYRSMADAARAGLRASLTDDAAYRKAGADMVRVLATLDDIDSLSRALAGAHHLELPPVAIPSSAGTTAP
jgi:hypothetical protein